jgi:hypothetical protein
MARFKKMTVAAYPHATEPEPLAADEQAITGGAALVVARDAVKRAPVPQPEDRDRFATLQQITVHADDQTLARAAVEAAARLWCMKPGEAAEADRKAVGQVARFLVWAAFGDIVDEGRAFTRANVNEYLAVKATTSESSARQQRYVLYAIGRQLHPHEFPPARGMSVPRRKRLLAASRTEIAKLQAIIPGLPTMMALRTQALLDLASGAGARPGDFKTLRGTAITSIAIDGQAIAVVTLPNHLGGVRQIPVVDPKVSARLLALSARVGTGLVLAPKATKAERNIVNRINSDLRRYGHPTTDPIALRHRWILDLAQTAPAALLLQLADVGDLRVLVDQRPLLPTYKLRHAITILQETQK